jgi:hypothetical protein
MRGPEKLLDRLRAGRLRLAMAGVQGFPGYEFAAVGHPLAPSSIARVRDPDG